MQHVSVLLPFCYQLLSFLHFICFSFAKEYGQNIKRLLIAGMVVLSEFWVFQEKVDMKVSAFSFTTSLLVFGYL